MLAELPAEFPRGRQFIIVDEWGPFDFKRPVAVLDTIAGNRYSFVLIGPSGSWKITDMKGVKSVSAAEGSVPDALIVEKDPAADLLALRFDYICPVETVNTFGEKIPAGRPYPFEFRRLEKKFDWKVQFFNYDGDTPPQNFTALKPAAEKQVSDLYFAWWDKPADVVNEDRFATVSTTEFTIAPGEYTMELTSDDGARLYLDGKLIIDNWDVHEPETDEAKVRLGGKHSLRIEHFEAGGFSTLGWRLKE
jgi:hypothetical protein